jgi:hypothetical protein
LFNEAFEVRNPFIWSTRTEVVKKIADSGFADMIRHTVSCTRIREMTKLNPHCGLCWQCIDRRFSMLATGLEEADPIEGYKVELFKGERLKGPDREMALSYARLTTEIRRMPDVAFFERFGEANRIIDCFEESANIVGKQIYDLYQRHAKAVCKTLDDALRENVQALREQRLSPDCLLSLIMTGSFHRGEEKRVSDLPRFDELFRDTRVKISIDEVRHCVVLADWGTITGKSADIFIVLAKPFREAETCQLPPESFAFTSPKLLSQSLGIEEPTLRQQIRRCRRKIHDCALNAGVNPPGTDSIIENDAWRGYRLNPDHVRIVSLEEPNAKYA